MRKYLCAASELNAFQQVKFNFLYGLEKRGRDPDSVVATWTLIVNVRY